MRTSYENALASSGHTGSYHYRRLLDWYDNDIVLDIGKELRLTRRDAMSKYGCVNFRALKNLETVLRALKVPTIERLSQIDPYSLHNTEGVGYTTLYAAMCLLSKHGYDPISWWGWQDAAKRKKAPGSKHPVKNGGHNHAASVS